MKKMLVVMSMLGLITSCGGDSTSNQTESSSVTATFTDSPVKGLKVIKADGDSIMTDSLGQFNCTLGETLKFMIGNFQLGSDATCAKDMNPMSLVPTTDDYLNDSVLNIALILQKLDADANPDSGLIEIPEAVHDFSYTSVDITDTASTGGIPNIVTAITNEIASKASVSVDTARTLAQARTHLGKNVGEGGFSASLTNSTNLGQTLGLSGDYHCPTGFTIKAEGESLSITTQGSTEFNTADFSDDGGTQRDFSNNSFVIDLATNSLDYDGFCAVVQGSCSNATYNNSVECQANGATWTSDYTSGTDSFVADLDVTGSIDMSAGTASGSYTYTLDCGKNGNPSTFDTFNICVGTYSGNVE